MKIKSLFTPPQSEITLLTPISVMCQSPGNGGELGDNEFEPVED